MTDNTTAPAPAMDPQDPLPEANWLWRRVLTYVLCAAVLTIMAGCGYVMFRIVGSITGKLDTMNAASVVQITLAALRTIEQMFRLMFWSLMVIVTYYMVAPSAEQITKMMQTAGLLKAGVQFASRTVETDTKREVAATAGQPPQPIVPPAASEAPTEGGQPASEAPTEGGMGLDAPKIGQEGGQESDSAAPGTVEAPDLPPPSSGLKIDAILKGDNA